MKVFGGFGNGGFDVDLGDIFSSFFGGGASRTQRRNGPQRGRDIRVRVDISFQEAAFGVTKEITVNRQEQCDTCKGTGCNPGTSEVTCKACGGRGQVTRDIISASLIRKLHLENKDITPHIPIETKKYLYQNLTNELYFPYLKYKILSTKNLSIYQTVEEGIENRIKKAITISNSWEELIQNR